jgi:D-3-phosphoglycerate dehydrogenase
MHIVATEPLRGEFIAACATLGNLKIAPDAWRTEAATIAALHEAEIVLTRNKTPISRTVLEAAGKLRCVVVYGAGQEHIDLTAANERGMYVVRCSEATADSVAEFTLGLILSLLRRIPEALDAVRRGRWEHRKLEGVELRGKVAAVIGCGPVGRRVARLLSSLGVRVLIVRQQNRELPPDLVEVNCMRTNLRSALRAADLVSLHVCGGEATRNLIGWSEIRQMRQGSFIINTSRGSALALDALLDGLSSGRLRGAALDVLPVEPPPMPIPWHPHLIITPHLALYSREAVERRIRFVTDRLRDWQRSQP